MNISIYKSCLRRLIRQLQESARWVGEAYLRVLALRWHCATRKCAYPLCGGLVHIKSYHFDIYFR